MKINCQPVMCLKVTDEDEIDITSAGSKLLEVGMLVTVEYNDATKTHSRPMYGIYDNKTVTGRISKINPNPFDRNDYGYLEIDISKEYHSETVSIKTDDIVNINVLR